MTRQTAWRQAPLAAALLLACSQSAFALDWTGYFRGGPGLTQKDTSRACYALNGGSAGLKYRLGNECDIYGEFQMSQNIVKDGIDSKVVLMTNYYNNATDVNSADGLKITQMYGETKGFDFAPGATFWIGKAWGRRGDVHIVDTFFVDMVGVGAGARDFQAGPGKFAMAYYKTENDATHPGNRLNFEYYDIATNPGGKVHFYGTLTQGQFTGGTKGAGLTARLDQDDLLGTGLKNMAWIQYAQGSAGLNANFGNLSYGQDSKNWRIVESVNWQKGAFGGQALVLFAAEKDGAGNKTNSATIGGRVSYAVTKNFKMLGELGFSQVKPDGGEKANLTKLTIAPTLSTGPDFWNRPELRLYATFAKWNKAAGNVTGQSGFDDKTSGNSFGAQIEWWF